MKIWKLKKAQDFRIRTRHPWIFAGELFDSPKSIKPGELIELHDFQGHFLARGYGNPVSQIAFRALSFLKEETNILEAQFIVDRLVKAWTARNRFGFDKSFRICFSEADGLPGLILDRYLIRKDTVDYQVFSYQLLTAGLDLAFKTNDQWKVIFENLVQQSFNLNLSHVSWDNTLILQRNDVQVRKLEGLNVEPPVILKGSEQSQLDDVKIVVQNVFNKSEEIFFNVNLIEGQKTGFFLDQTFNMKLLIDLLNQQKQRFENKTVRILDLCCYMGQWSSQIVRNLKNWNIQAEVVLVDVSDLALKKAEDNLKQYNDDDYSLKVTCLKKDVLDLENSFSDRFDIVISDPPAFVKNKKDIHQGLHAYQKLNTQAFKLATEAGIIVSCTCSGLVQLPEFKEVLNKSILRSGKTGRIVCYGGQGWDHPTLTSFPDGFYLKMVLHQLD